MNFGGAYMQLDLGQKIRELRRRDGRTQEALAEAIGVTSQAVSRWEANGGYPDMEMIPSIANYFGISIDELFGYNNERSKKIDELAAKIDQMNFQNNGVDIISVNNARFPRLLTKLESCPFLLYLLGNMPLLFSSFVFFLNNKNHNTLIKTML